MKKPYTETTGLAYQLRRLALTAVLAGSAAVAAQAQVLNYAISTATNVAGTYTDLATVSGSRVIATANTDDANSAPQEIGFAFNYNGASFTQFVLNTNGIMRLGGAPPSVANLFAAYETGQALGVDPISSTSPADVNLIAPFNFDLQDGSVGPAEYRVATTGTGTSQVCTIQWKNVRDKAGTTNATQFDNFEFQVKLYQATGTIELVYGPVVSATAGASINRFPTVGIKGSGSAAGQDILVNKASSTAAWSTAIFITGTYASTTLNYRRTYGPDLGRTFRFATAPSNDAAVAGIYTLGKLATLTALPHAVQAVVTNTGAGPQTNLPVTLAVTGANTFSDTKTIAALAPGASATVTFAAYPTTLAVGDNVLTVTIPADGNAANNTATYGQTVTTNRLSYTNPTGTTAGSVGIGSGAGVLAQKFTLPAATVVSDVVLTLAASADNTAPFQVLLYDATATGGLPGQLLYTSPTQNRTAAAGPVTVTLPGIAVPASFYVAVKETSATNIAIAYQTEDPIRPNTFYFSTTGTTWTDFVLANPKARVALEIGTTIPNCAAPTAVVASNVTPTGATIAFTPPTTGTSSYQLVYGPTGFNVGTSGTTIDATTSPVTLTGLTPATSYQVYVRSNCTAGGTSIYSAPLTFITACDPVTTVATFPYNQNFDTILPGQALPCGITTLDANGDGTTWRISTESPNSGLYAMRYQGAVVNNTAANDWFFTPPLVLPAAGGTRYQVAFRYRAAGIGAGTSNFTESLEVKSGSAATAAGQTNLLYTNAAINNLSYAQAGGASTPVVAYLPAGASTQYVGFHVTSAANQSNLYIDDLTVTAVTVTATSEALLRAISVFPNPSTTGVFDLAINGANARKGLQVEVVNNLGQLVYTGAARDNFTNQLDLSRLVTGLYHLKITNGDEYILRQLSIIK
jgi:hypothetical protein